MRPGRRLFVLLYAASGAAALVYEVTWTRLLTLQLGHTVAAASTVLAAFMGGLALGAWIAGAVRRACDAFAAYAILEILVAICALLLPVALAASVPALAWAYADGGAPARFAVVRIAISLALLGIPAAAMGATFPIAAGWYARNAADTGVLYAVNTAGAALGAIAAGFFLIPAIGLRATTWIGVLLNLVAAAGAWWLASGSRSEKTAELAKTAEVSFSKSKKNKTGSALLRDLRGLRGFFRACSCAAARLRRGGDLRFRRPRLRSRLHAAARPGHRPDHLCVRDDGGGVHQRAGDRIRARQRVWRGGSSGPRSGWRRCSSSRRSRPAAPRGWRHRGCRWSWPRRSRIRPRPSRP